MCPSAGGVALNRDVPPLLDTKSSPMSWWALFTINLMTKASVVRPHLSGVQRVLEWDSENLATPPGFLHERNNLKYSQASSR